MCIRDRAYTGKETQAKALPGYVRLGYGNYGNLDVRANYLFSLSPKDRLKDVYKRQYFRLNSG